VNHMVSPCVEAGQSTMHQMLRRLFVEMPGIGDGDHFAVETSLAVLLLMGMMHRMPVGSVAEVHEMFLLLLLWWWWWWCCGGVEKRFAGRNEAHPAGASVSKTCQIRADERRFHFAARSGPWCFVLHHRFLLLVRWWWWCVVHCWPMPPADQNNCCFPQAPDSSWCMWKISAKRRGCCV